MHGHSKQDFQPKVHERILTNVYLAKRYEMLSGISAVISLNYAIPGEIRLIWLVLGKHFQNEAKYLWEW